jgi:hypothetical protein
MTRHQLTITIMTLTVCGTLVARGGATTPDEVHGSATAPLVTYAGSGIDKLGTSSYTFILKCRIGVHSLGGSLRISENGRESGTYQLEAGLVSDNTLSFYVDDGKYQRHFSLRSIDGNLYGGIVELSEKGLSGLTQVHFMAEK